MITAFHKVTLSVIFLGSLLLLISALKPGQGFRNRNDRLTALTGLVGLVYVGMELGWYFYYVGFLQSRGVATAYYFASHLLGGLALGMLFYIASPKSTRVALLISGLSFVAFNLLAIAYYGPRHLASAIRFFCFGQWVVHRSVNYFSRLSLARPRRG